MPARERFQRPSTRRFHEQCRQLGLASVATWRQLEIPFDELRKIA